MNQQGLIKAQDDQLDLLSAGIGDLREIGMEIGSKADQSTALLDDVHGMVMSWHATRLLCFVLCNGFPFPNA